MSEPASIEHPSPDSVVVRRWFPAPPSLIWTFWTRPEHMVRWWGPATMKCQEVKANAVPGGEWSIEMAGESGAVYRVRGRYEALEPPTRLVSSWVWVDGGGEPGRETRYEVLFEEDGEGTALTLTHSNLNEEMAASHGGGWMSTLDSLEAFIARQG